MKASVIIPTYSRADQLSRTLKSLTSLDTDPRDYEIIVVDNGSTDNTRNVVENCMKTNSSHFINYFYDDVPGLLTGRHRGAKESKCEILCFIDDDIHADKGWLNAIIDTFERRKDVHLVGGKCLPAFEADPPHWLKYFWRNAPGGGMMMIDLSLCDFSDEEKEVHPTWIWGLNFSIRRKTFYEAGGFHPDSITPQYQKFQGDGETGLSYKILELGYKSIYNPKVLVHHEVPLSRMTNAYFEKRSFYQGVCNSYTEIRKTGKVGQSKIRKIFAHNLRPATGKILRALGLRQDDGGRYSLNETEMQEKKMLIARFRAKEEEGYNFHQREAMKSPAVLKWILKEDYFDYKLPEST